MVLQTKIQLAIVTIESLTKQPRSTDNDSRRTKGAHGRVERPSTPYRETSSRGGRRGDGEVASQIRPVLVHDLDGAFAISRQIDRSEFRQPEPASRADAKSAKSGHSPR